MLTHLGFGSLAVVALLACQPGGANRPYTALSQDGRELRAAFNADSERVRVIMLVAPT